MWLFVFSTLKFSTTFSYSLRLLLHDDHSNISNFNLSLSSYNIYIQKVLCVWRSWDRASWYISIVKSTRCTIFLFYWIYSTCFGRSFRPSSRVQGCTYNVRYMSYRLVDCLLASSQLACMTYTWRCMYSLELLMVDGKTTRNM
jgi:hypothetical protein